MFYSRHQIKSISGEALDDYLSRGWYRMGNSVFTTQFLFFDKKMFSAIWLRMQLQDFSFKKRHRKLKNKVEKELEVKIGPATFTQEKENLFEIYKQNFKGSLYSTINMYMLDDASYNAFNTYEVSIYDKGKLVGFSYFDIGRQTVASILAAYLPEYSKFSLGIYTMLAEVQFCIDNKFETYYPGYFVPNYSRFDYKYTLGNCEFFNFINKEWEPLDDFKEENDLSIQLRSKIVALTETYNDNDIESYIILYRNFEIGQFNPSFGYMFQHPLMVLSIVNKNKYKNGNVFVTEYDLLNDLYKVSLLSKPTNIHYTVNNKINPNYSTLVIENILQSNKLLIKDGNLGNCINVILNNL